MAHIGDIRRAHRSERVSKAFSERIMLAVTEVNGCRYCSYYHTSVALKAGLQEGEVQDILSGDLSSAPAEETVALLFAQHYAETEGHPEEEACQRLLETYGPETDDRYLGGHPHDHGRQCLRHHDRSRQEPLNLEAQPREQFGP